jgi:hypothetical protein
MEDKSMIVFLKGNRDILPFLYATIRPAFHRGLSPELLDLDRPAITAFVKTSAALMIFFSMTALPPSSALKQAFGEMLPVRNADRSAIQRKVMVDIVEFVIRVLRLQQQRIATTLVGFGLLRQIYMNSS